VQTARSTSAELKSASADALLVVCGNQLNKQFGDRWILRDASINIPPGESVALLGESGVGKSTVLNILAGREPADAGQLSVAGHDLRPGSFDADASAAMRREKIGFVFQAFHLLPHLSVWQNIAVPLLLTGVTPSAARAPVEQLLKRIGLADRAEARPNVLSGGEQQRVSLARALIHRPVLLLADEPTGNLDPQTAGQALGLMREIVDETQCAMLMVTHSDQAAAICERHLRLKSGVIESVQV